MKDGSVTLLEGACVILSVIWIVIPIFSLFSSGSDAPGAEKDNDVIMYTRGNQAIIVERDSMSLYDSLFVDTMKKLCVIQNKLESDERFLKNSGKQSKVSNP